MTGLGAKFSADTTQVDAAMRKATQSVERFGRAAQSIDGKKAEGFSKQINSANESIGKMANLLRGGAIVAGLTGILNGFNAIAQAAKNSADQSDKNVQAAQRWGSAFETVKREATSFGIQFLGTLNRIGEKIGEVTLNTLGLGGLIDPRNSATQAELDRAKQGEVAALKKVEEAQARNRAAAEKLKDVQAKITEERIKEMREGMAPAMRLQSEREVIEGQISDLVFGRIQNAETDLRIAELRLDLLRKEREIRQQTAQDERQKTVRQKAERAQVDADAQRMLDEFAAQEKAAQDEIAAIKERRRQAEMSAEDKLRDVVERGRKALVEATRYGTEQSKLEVERLRDEYAALKAEIDAVAESARGLGGSGGKSTEARLAAIGLTRGEDGKLRRGNVIVSDEDAARTLADRERNARLQSRTQSQQIRTRAEREQSAQGKSEEARVLAEILKALTTPK